MPLNTFFKHANVRRALEYGTDVDYYVSTHNALFTTDTFEAIHRQLKHFNSFNSCYFSCLIDKSKKKKNV